MDLDQLLDPARLASIWDAPRSPARSGEPDARPGVQPDSQPGRQDAMAAPAGRSATRMDTEPDAALPGPVPPPDARASFFALKAEARALFAPGTNARRIVDEALAALENALFGPDPAPVKPGDLDDLEDFVETFCAAQNWAAPEPTP